MPEKKVLKNEATSHEESAFDIPEDSQKEEAVSQRTNKKKWRILAGVSLTLIVIFLTGLNFFLNYQRNQNLQKNPVVASEIKQEAIVGKVGKLIELPKNEQPTIATVSDISKLKGQPFFQNAKNGDIVLIYPKTNEAILFDPDANRILLIAPISTNHQAVAGTSTQANPTQPSSISPSPAQVTIALYNGTTIDGLTRKVQSLLATDMPNATVVQNANASKQDYTQTLVIDLTGKESSSAKQLATVLHGTVSSMPSNETVPVNAEILVILGTK
jgi:hypothetical protein